MDGVAYVANGAGIIIAHSRDANRSPGDAAAPLEGPIAVGRSLYDSINGDVVLQTYRKLHEEVWQRRRASVSFFYRCDTPQAERLMRMSMTLLCHRGQAAGVVYQSVLVGEVSRVPIPLFDQHVLSARTPQRSTLPTVLLCAFCLDVGWPSDSGGQPQVWISAVDYYRRGGRADILFSHGICPPCAERVMADDAATLPFTQLP